MSSLIGDSIVYGGAWTSGALREVFEEVPKTRAWLEILAVLAETQSVFGLIPERDARAVAATCRTIEVDDAFLLEVRAGYESSGHSLVGLLDAVARRCPGETGEWVCYGATVQDITDTWLMTALGRVRETIGRDLVAIDGRLVGSRPRAPRHADGGSHARPARAADHVRLQGRRVGCPRSGATGAGSTSCGRGWTSVSWRAASGASRRSGRVPSSSRPDSSSGWASVHRRSRGPRLATSSASGVAG